jgi:hypothetical protein
MDPEDLLYLDVEDIPELPDHSVTNQETLKMLKENGISSRYTRLELYDRYGTRAADIMARNWNKALTATQRVRLASAVETDGGDDELLIAESTFDDGPSEISDES